MVLQWHHCKNLLLEPLFLRAHTWYLLNYWSHDWLIYVVKFIRQYNMKTWGKIIRVQVLQSSPSLFLWVKTLTESSQIWLTPTVCEHRRVHRDRCELDRQTLVTGSALLTYTFSNQVSKQLAVCILVLCT